MFPQFASISTSWEGHLGGAVAGVAAAILFRNKGPQRPEPFKDEEDINIEENTEEEDTSNHFFSFCLCHEIQKGYLYPILFFQNIF